MDSLRLILPLLMALGTSFALDSQMQRRGLLPPNFRLAEGSPGTARQRAVLLRTAALSVVAFVLWVGIFAPIGMTGQADSAAPVNPAIPDLFALHLVFLVGLGIWYSLGFWGSPRSSTNWRDQLGLGGANIGREIGIGLVAGVAGWLGVIAVLLLVALVVYLVGGEDALPTDPPPIITWVVALPIGVRLALSLSAGVVEEMFFRGFLQPRIGLAVSSMLFVLAHLSYDQPFLLIGVALLSVLFAVLVQWRQSIWAAMTAHAVFDAIQLLFVIPNAIKLLDQEDSGIVANLVAALTRI